MIVQPYRREEASAPFLSKTQAKYLKCALKKLGFRSYRQYLLSMVWESKKKQYRTTGLPQECGVCGDPQVDLHHRTYKTLGQERMTDLVPLCQEHHQDAHELDRRMLAAGVQHQGLWQIVRILKRECEQEAEAHLPSRSSGQRSGNARRQGLSPVPAHPSQEAGAR